MKVSIRGFLRFLTKKIKLKFNIFKNIFKIRFDIVLFTITLSLRESTKIKDFSNTISHLKMGNGINHNLSN
jgi:hypothetical protein